MAPRGLRRPDDGPVHLAHADAYVRLLQPALAIQALRTGLAALPGSSELLDKLARIEQQR